MNIAIEEHFHLTEKIQRELTDIYPKIFESFNEKNFFKKFTYHSQFFILMAYVDQRPVGFKIGYGQDPELFYSWTGGVLPQFRKMGIANTLMVKQHEWCKQNGYSIIETRTRNKFPEMIALNMKFNFQIVGTFTDTDKSPKIILRKAL
jgi:predicted GNAT superfamily acetyltransferase